MNLTLEVTGAQAGALGPARRKVFAATGGTIGRVAGNQWVLQHQYVSSRHAIIHYENGAYTIEDQRSANGVFINSLENRLAVGERYVLRDGDTIFIDPFEIRVTLSPAPRAAAASDPFALDDFFHGPGTEATSALSPASGELDPMSLLNLDPPARPAASAPRSDDLRRGSVVDEHYRPPAVSPPAASAPAPAEGAIPEDWLRADESVAPSIPVPRPGTRQDRAARAATPPPPARPHPTGAARPREGASAGSRPNVPSTPPPVPTSGPDRSPARASERGPVDVDLAHLFAGAGLDPADVTPELAQSFGQILRVVVAGLIDVLQARRVIKEEFRVKGITRFERANNNPLKFSANVEDALHNLLVKRNAGYLGPVEAFEDAFGDLRNHQMAMLAGIRVAFEAMLAEFHPDRLQPEFDRQIKKGALVSVPAKLRYWDLYREKFGDMVRDADASFAELFGDEFARAYEEQLERLKPQSRSDKR